MVGALGKQSMRWIVLMLALALGSVAQAAQQIEVVAHFADVPAGAEVPGAPARLSAMKEINLLSSPRITVMENVPGEIEIVQETPVPGGGQVPLGVSLTVKTYVTEKGNIWFSGNLTDRSRGGGEKSERLETAGFATREWYFSGWTPNTGTALIRTTPVSSQVVREGKTVTKSRELVVYLTFTKSAPPPSAGKKPTTTKKTTTSKTSTKKKR